MVRDEPPKMATTIPPQMAEITPAIGGASEANANPRHNGNAIKDTTKPEKIFWGSVLMKSPMELFLLMGFGCYD
jgi:hypothetical protein